MRSYKPTYVWPNPAFPFRIYYDGPECRVFIIENIQHNWEWLSAYANKIRSNDYFFVYCGWYHSEHFAREAEAIFDELNLSKNNFFVMFNSPLEKKNFEPFGFRGNVINHNAWLNEQLMMPLPGIEKKFDAIYVARLSAFKRHRLAKLVPNLALVAGINHGNPIEQDLPRYIYRNERPLIADEVCQRINEARCGLLLSEQEGACFSSSEYLLCGIPVVSTHSFGGRDVWYNDYNSIIVEPDPTAIANAVIELRETAKDPNKIRTEHMSLAKLHRARFVDELHSVFSRFNVDIDAQEYFDDNYMHKMRTSYKPNFEEIFT